jgi:protein tyrosine/serine phosphatase
MTHHARALPVVLVVALLASCAPSRLSVRFVEPGLWRSNQPTSVADWARIKSLGIGIVVKLNMPGEGSDEGARRLGLVVYELGIQPVGDPNILDAVTNSFRSPDPERLAAAEEVIESAAGRTGVLVHCTHGQDRTGLVIGRHRVLADGWSKSRAYREMLANGFHPALIGLQAAWRAFEPPPRE